MSTPEMAFTLLCNFDFEVTAPSESRPSSSRTLASVPRSLKDVVFKAVPTESASCMIALAVAVNAAASAKSPPAATNDADDFVNELAKSAVEHICYEYNRYLYPSIYHYIVSDHIILSSFGKRVLSFRIA